MQTLSIGLPLISPPLHRRLEGVYYFTSVHPSVRPKIFFVTYFSATIDGRNLIFGYKLHIGTCMPYCVKHFWTRQIPTSCLPTQLAFIHIEQICTFFVAFFKATIDNRKVIFGRKLHIGMPYCGKHFWTCHCQIPTSCLPTQFFLYTLIIYDHFSSHFSQQLLMAEI